MESVCGNTSLAIQYGESKQLCLDHQAWLICVGERLPDSSMICLFPPPHLSKVIGNLVSILFNLRRYWLWSIWSCIYWRCHAFVLRMNFLSNLAFRESHTFPFFSHQLLGFFGLHLFHCCYDYSVLVQSCVLCHGHQLALYHHIFPHFVMNHVTRCWCFT